MEIQKRLLRLQPLKKGAIWMSILVWGSAASRLDLLLGKVLHRTGGVS